MRLYGDPVDRDKLVRPTLPDEPHWGEGTWREGGNRTGESRLIYYAPTLIPGQATDITYGEFVEALIGFQYVNHDYPRMEIYA